MFLSDMCASSRKNKAWTFICNKSTVLEVQSRFEGEQIDAFGRPIVLYTPLFFSLTCFMIVLSVKHAFLSGDVWEDFRDRNFFFE